MPHSFGKRARTRDKFAKAFRTKGRSGLSTYLTPFKRGDYVDIKVDPSQQKGMPYQFYHGRTGVIFNVNPRAVGVEVTKVVGNRQLQKRMHIRIEHLRRSRCNEDFLARVKKTDVIKSEAKKKGEKVVVKRYPQGPRPAEIIKAAKTVVKTFSPLEFISNRF